MTSGGRYARQIDQCNLCYVTKFDVALMSQYNRSCINLRKKSKTKSSLRNARTLYLSGICQYSKRNYNVIALGTDTFVGTLLSSSATTSGKHS